MAGISSKSDGFKSVYTKSKIAIIEMLESIQSGGIKFGITRCTVRTQLMYGDLWGIQERWIGVQKLKSKTFILNLMMRKWLVFLRVFWWIICVAMSVYWREDRFLYWKHFNHWNSGRSERSSYNLWIDRESVIGTRRKLNEIPAGKC